MAPRKIGPVSYDDRLSIVEHLTELRVRIVFSLVVFTAIFGLCFWQNELCLSIINKPLEHAGEAQGSGPLGSLAKQQRQTQKLHEQLAKVSRLAAVRTEDPELKREFQALNKQAESSAKAVASTHRRPVTLGVGEPFTATLQIAIYTALLISLPFLLYQIYAFVLPAFSKREREIALPAMLCVPFLFFAGVSFGYFIVLPRAIHFLQNFNDESFDILLQAKEYYRFSILFLGVLGFVFQIPVLVLAITRLGILTPAQLRANRRYAIVVIALIAMFMPGPDPLSMLLCMAPLLLLYEGSILLASMFDKRAARSVTRDDDEGIGSAMPAKINDEKKELASSTK